jgi:hypothetical protein
MAKTSQPSVFLKHPSEWRFCRPGRPCSSTRSSFRLQRNCQRRWSRKRLSLYGRQPWRPCGRRGRPAAGSWCSRRQMSSCRARTRSSRRARSSSPRWRREPARAVHVEAGGRADFDRSLPAGQFIYSSVNVVASVFDAILRAAQVVCVHLLYILYWRRSLRRIFTSIFFSLLLTFVYTFLFDILGLCKCNCCHLIITRQFHIWCIRLLNKTQYSF